MKKSFTLSKVEKLPESQVLIEGEIDFAVVAKYEGEVIAKFQATADIPGFRKGHVPPAMIAERLGEMTILSEAAELALNEAYPDILESEKIFAVGPPEVSITKLAKDNPLGFKITVATLPEIRLPDYKKMIKKESADTEPAEATDQELEDVIREIRTSFAHAELHKTGAEHDHAHPQIEDKDLPPFDDAFVKTIGPFQSLEDFKGKARENIKNEKQKRAREKKREKILETILNETDIVVPKIVIESELQKMFLQFEEDVKRAGTNMDDYLKHVKKTREDILAEWRPTAQKKAKVQLLLNKISEVEKISPDNDKVRTETEKIMIMHPDADPVKARLYVAQMYLNEKVMEFLEGLK